MKNIKKTLIIIAVVLFIIDLAVVVYYSFIKKNNNYTLKSSLKVEKDYEFVLSNIKKEVDEYDVNNYSPNYEIDMNTNNPIKIEKDEVITFNNTESILYPMMKKDNCLYVILSLSNNHDIDVVFISSNSNAYKYNLRASGDSINKIINYKDLPKGRYHIYITDNEDKYDTMQTITIE